MSDVIHFSLWFVETTPALMLARLTAAVAVLPAESQERGVRQVTVRALDWDEPELLEERFDTGVTPEAAVEAARAYVSADCACEWEMSWRLWRYEGSSWEQVWLPLRFTAVGADFGAATAATEGELVVDFGLDEAFLCELAPWDVETRRRIQANILQLLAFCRKLEMGLQPKRRRLWTEEEEDLAARLSRRLQLAQHAIG